MDTNTIKQKYAVRHIHPMNRITTALSKSVLRERLETLKGINEGMRLHARCVFEDRTCSSSQQVH